ncbi:MAG: esterase-like activity of phytase family protein [Acidimicrobiia bacterium]
MTGPAVGRALAAGLLALAAATVPAQTVPAETAWPGGEARPADERVTLGGNLSGLAWAVGGGALWAVRDPGELLRLVWRDGVLVPDAGWGDGRPLRWPDGDGVPDAEAVAVTDRTDVVYVAAERDNTAAGRSRPAVLEVPVTDVTGDAARLVASRAWELTDLLAPLPANAGVEGLAWVPDDILVAAGFRDATGRAYDPAEHPDHGSGVFVAGLEDGGELAFLVLGADGPVLLATVPSGLPAVMEVAWDAGRGVLWALCDDHCDGRMVQLAFADSAPGHLAPVGHLRPPDGLAALNDEGFAVHPACTDGTTTAVWADDLATDGHALRQASLNCDEPGSPAAPPSAPSSATATPSTSTATPSTTPPAAAPSTVAPQDTSARWWVPAIVVPAIVVPAVAATAAAVGIRRRRPTSTAEHRS